MPAHPRVPALTAPRRFYWDFWHACGGGGGGWGNLRVAKTPPLQEALRGMPPPGIYAHVGINREGVEGDDDAARRVATVFDNLNCMIENSLPARR